MTKINITPLGDTLTILKGQALEPKHPEKLSIKGNILSVGNYLKARYGDRVGAGLQEVDASSAVVIVNEKDMTITLLTDPNDVFGTEVKGALELTDELKAFCINGTKQFTREELIKLLRFNKRYFDSPEKYEELLKAYQTMQIKTASELKQESDTRGNKGMNFQKTVDSASIPTEFKMHIPVFKGFPSKVFRVEICLDATDSSVRFWLESVELHELIIVERDLIFNEQLKACDDFVVIHQ